jgi:hypothetical protein
MTRMHVIPERVTLATELRVLLMAERATNAAELARTRDQNDRLRQISRELQRARVRPPFGEARARSAEPRR